MEQEHICLLTEQRDLCDLLCVLNAGTDSGIGVLYRWARAKESIISFEFVK